MSDHNNKNNNDTTTNVIAEEKSNNNDDSTYYPFYAVRDSYNSKEEGNACIFTKKEVLDRFITDQNNNNKKNPLEYSGFHTIDMAVAFIMSHKDNTNDETSKKRKNQQQQQQQQQLHEDENTKDEDQDKDKETSIVTNHNTTTTTIVNDNNTGKNQKSTSTTTTTRRKKRQRIENQTKENNKENDDDGDNQEDDDSLSKNKSENDVDESKQKNKQKEKVSSPPTDDSTSSSKKKSKDGEKNKELSSLTSTTRKDQDNNCTTATTTANDIMAPTTNTDGATTGTAIMTNTTPTMGSYPQPPTFFPFPPIQNTMMPYNNNINMFPPFFPSMMWPGTSMMMMGNTGAFSPFATTTPSTMAMTNVLPSPPPPTTPLPTTGSNNNNNNNNSPSMPCFTPGVSHGNLPTSNNTANNNITINNTNNPNLVLVPPNLPSNVNNTNNNYVNTTPPPWFGMMTTTTTPTTPGRTKTTPKKTPTKSPQILSGLPSYTWERMFLQLRAYHESHDGKLPPLLPEEENNHRPTVETVPSPPANVTAATSSADQLQNNDSSAQAPGDSNAIHRGSTSPPADSSASAWTPGETSVATALVNQALVGVDSSVIDRAAATTTDTATVTDNPLMDDSSNTNNSDRASQQHVLHPSSNEDGESVISPELIKWMKKQQRDYKSFKEDNTGPFSKYEEKIQKLEELGFDFGYISWDDRLNQLRQVSQAFDEYQKRTAPPPPVPIIVDNSRRGRRRPITTAAVAATLTAAPTTGGCDRPPSAPDIKLESILEAMDSNHYRGGVSRTNNDADTNRVGGDDGTNVRNNANEGNSNRSSNNNNNNNRNIIDVTIRGMNIDFDRNDGYDGLWKWFEKQRQQCRLFLTGKPCKITKKQMEDLFALKLTAFDPVRLLEPKSNKRDEKRKERKAQRLEERDRLENEEWEAMFQKLVKNFRDNGAHFIPANATTELSNWVITVRTAFKELEEITFPRFREEPPSPLQVAQDLPIVMDTSQTPKGQRLLTSERIRRLHALGFVFRKRLRSSWISFEDRVEHLKQFKAEFGHLKVPKSYTAIPGLGMWTSKQRWEYHKHYIDNENMMDQEDTDIDDGDDFDLDDECSEGNDGSNAATKKKKKKKSKNKRYLTPERVQILDDMGFTWCNGKRRDPSLKRSWDERFEELLQYQRDYGTTIVPQNYIGLGQWVQSQRKHYKWLNEGRQSPMTAKQVSKLIGCGFVWVVKPRRQQQQQQSRQMNDYSNRQDQYSDDTDSDSE